jgi:hypothetical protein
MLLVIDEKVPELALHPIIFPIIAVVLGAILLT